MSLDPTPSEMINSLSPKELGKYKKGKNPAQCTALATQSVFGDKNLSENGMKENEDHLQYAQCSTSFQRLTMLKTLPASQTLSELQSVSEVLTWKRPGKNLRSPAWRHFFKHSTEEKAKCGQCGKVLSTPKFATTTMIRHLKTCKKTQESRDPNQCETLDILSSKESKGKEEKSQFTSLANSVTELDKCVNVSADRFQRSLDLTQAKSSKESLRQEEDVSSSHSKTVTDGLVSLNMRLNKKKTKIGAKKRHERDESVQNFSTIQTMPSLQSLQSFKTLQNFQTLESSPKAVLEGLTWKQPEKSLKSSVWMHFFRHSSEEKGVCRHCGKVLSTPKSSTSNLKRHLNRCKKIKDSWGPNQCEAPVFLSPEELERKEENENQSRSTTLFSSWTNINQCSRVSTSEFKKVPASIHFKALTLLPRKKLDESPSQLKTIADKFSSAEISSNESSANTSAKEETEENFVESSTLHQNLLSLQTLPSLSPLPTSKTFSELSTWKEPEESLLCPIKKQFLMHTLEEKSKCRHCGKVLSIYQFPTSSFKRHLRICTVKNNLLDFGNYRRKQRNYMKGIRTQKYGKIKRLEARTVLAKRIQTHRTEFNRTKSKNLIGKLVSEGFSFCQISKIAELCPEIHHLPKEEEKLKTIFDIVTNRTENGNRL